MEIQHSIEWFRKRLGNFTGSQIGLLMKKEGEVIIFPILPKLIFIKLHQRGI